MKLKNNRLLYKFFILLTVFLLSGCSSFGGEISDTLLKSIGWVKFGKPKIVKSVSNDKYAYNMLNEEEKIVYDQIYDCIVNFKDNVSISTTDESELKKVYSCINADHPEIFWAKGYFFNVYKILDKSIGITFTPSYTFEQDEVLALQNQIDLVCDNWISELPENSSDYEKSRFVFEKLINEVEYNVDSDNNQNIVSVFINKETVCGGYARASSYMFEKMGIPSIVVSGYAADNQPHAWNIIMLDGKYYQFDVTWGNSKFTIDKENDKFINYIYLNAKDEDISLDHKSEMPIDLPVCDSTENGYFYKEKSFIPSNNIDDNLLNQIFINQYNQGKGSLSFKCEDEETFKELNNYLFNENHIYDYIKGVSKVSYFPNQGAFVLTILLR